MASREPKVLTGRHVFWMLAAFFGVMIAVNSVFVIAAVNSFTGEDVPKSYRQGLEYNEKLEARRQQSDLGWRVVANSFQENDQTRIVVKLQDDQAEALSGFQMQGTLRHPTDKALDQSLTFTDKGAGRYAANAQLPPGQWQLKAQAFDTDGQTFNFTHEIWVN